jgi:soluble lytic murein transglycosylase-like protein
MHTDNDKKKIKRVRVVTIPHPQEPTAPPKKKRSLKRIAFFNFLLLCIALFTLRTVSIAYVSMEKFIVHNTVAWYNYQFETLALEQGYTKDTPLPVTPKGFTIKRATIKAIKKYNVHPALYPILRGVIKRESNDNPYAESVAGAKGYMGLMPATTRKCGMINPKQAFIGEDNIDCGVFWFNEIFKESATLTIALKSYNAGASNIDKTKENQTYVDDVYASMLSLPPSELIYEEN